MSGGKSKQKSTREYPLKPNSGFVQIKVDVLMRVFARGELTRNEMQIVCCVICDSWRWEGRPTTRSRIVFAQIARDTGIPRQHVHRTWKKMVKDNKLKEHCDASGRGFRASFNEHVETWNVTKLVTSGRGKDVTNSVTLCNQNRDTTVTKLVTSLHKRRTSKDSLITKTITAKPIEEIREIERLWVGRFPGRKLAFGELSQLRTECQKGDVSPESFIESIPADHLSPWPLVRNHFTTDFVSLRSASPGGQPPTFAGWQLTLVNGSRRS